MDKNKEIKIMLRRSFDNSGVIMITDDQWNEACECLSGEGADTQLVRDLNVLGLDVYVQIAKSE